MTTTDLAQVAISRRHLYGALVLLFFVSFFNYMDRFMLSVLLPAIKRDLDLSDTQIGFLSGLAFTLFYALLGIPIARLADRYSRKTIIAIALTVWSFMTAACGLAQNFLQLAIARVMVGVGEAGASPASHSLIADYFPRASRGRALSVYTLGAPVGIFIGFSVGSWIAETYSWRVALMVLGLPGVALAAILYFSLREPTRGQSDGLPADGGLHLPLWQTIRALFRKRTFFHLALANGFYTVLWMGVVQWLPIFFTRVHDMSLAATGTALAFILGGAQFCGLLAGGIVADQLGRRNLRWYVWVPALSIFVSTPFFFVIFLATNQTIALVVLVVPFLISLMQGAPTWAVAQGVAAPHMRAMSSAVLLLVTNLIGGGIGPQAVGLLSDWFTPSYGDDGLRYALLIISVLFGFWAVVHYAIAGRTIAQDFENPATASAGRT